MKKLQNPTVDESEKNQGKVINKVSLKFPPDAVSKYSNFSTIQNEENGICILSFFEIQKPILLGSEEEIKANIEKLDSIPAVCISRIAMTKEQFLKFCLAVKSHAGKISQEEE